MGELREGPASFRSRRLLWQAAAAVAVLVFGYTAYVWGDEYSLNRRLVAESADHVLMNPALASYAV